MGDFVKLIIFSMFFGSSLCFGASVTLTNSSDCFLTAYLEDSKTKEVFSVPVINPQGGVVQIDLAGTVGPYTIEWQQLPTPSSDRKSCWGAGSFENTRTWLDSANFQGKGCCSLSGLGKPSKTSECASERKIVPCDQQN